MRDVFVDTEFTCFCSPALISLGAVSGADEFYVELTDVSLRGASSFVCEHVLPLLGRDPSKCLSTVQAGARLYEWLSELGPCRLVVDYEDDFNLLFELLGDELPPNVEPKPLLVMGTAIRNLDKNVYMTDNGLTMHHALHDARALQHVINKNT
jgi:hypothetical protein